MMRQSESPVHAAHRLGGSAWGRVSGGRLTLMEQMRWTCRALAAQWPALLLGSLPRSSALQARWARLDPDRIAWPDTAVVLGALEQAQAMQPSWLLQHTLRTWSWAVLFAQLDGWRPDPEVLAVACLLHDLELLPTTGLAPAHRCACFAVASGQVARRYLTAQGWSDERAGAVDDAICLHMNPSVTVDAGLEAHLLHAGAAMDVVGARAAELDSRVRQWVFDRHPRTGFEDGFVDAMRSQARAHPGSRTALLWRLGLAFAVRRAHRTA